MKSSGFSVAYSSGMRASNHCARNALGIADDRVDVPQRVVEIERDDVDARHRQERFARGWLASYTLARC